MDYKKLKEFPEGVLPGKHVGSGKPIISPGELGHPNDGTGIYKWIFVALFCVVLLASLAFVAICFAMSGRSGSGSEYQENRFMYICKKQAGDALDRNFKIEGTETSRLRAFILQCRRAGAVVMLYPEYRKCPSQSQKEFIERNSKCMHKILKKEGVTLDDLGMLPSYDVQPGYKSPTNDLKAVPDAYTARLTVTYGDSVLAVGPVIGETAEDAKDAVEIEALRAVLQDLYGTKDDDEGSSNRTLVGQGDDESSPDPVLTGEDDDKGSTNHVWARQGEEDSPDQVGKDSLKKEQSGEAAADQEQLPKPVM